MAEAKTTLPESVFAVEVANHELLKLAYDSYLANARLSSATTKTRGEVRGGGKKPHKQKGTGRARSGSSRNPLWRGGGIVFGPLGNENYKKTLPTHAKRVAIRQALTLAAQADKIIIAEAKTSGKTKDIVSFLGEHKADVRRVLLVVDEKTPELLRATANLRSVELVRATYLSVFHVLNADKIIISPSAVTAVTAWLGEKA
ncbi:MAG TPA: 50S ribosomal protein L4 [Candidatus Saccharimonadales bacterium]